MTTSVNTFIARGFNHNVRYRGVVFHIQTEASHHERPHVTTHVFVGGRIVASRGGGLEVTRDHVAARMKDQHRALMRALLRDELSIPSDVFGAERPAGPMKRATPPLSPRSRRPRASDEERVNTSLLLAVDHFRLLAETTEMSTLRPLGTALAVLRGLDVELHIEPELMRELLALQVRIVELYRQTSSPARAQIVTLRVEASELVVRLRRSYTRAAPSPLQARSRTRVH